MNNEELLLALQYINAVRERCRLNRLMDIPKGAAPDTAKKLSLTCPLAKAIPQSVIGDQYVRTTEEQMAEALAQSFGKPIYTLIEFPKEFVVDLPDVLISFISHYDQGWLPQFIEAS